MQFKNADKKKDGWMDSEGVRYVIKIQNVDCGFQMVNVVHVQFFQHFCSLKIFVLKNVSICWNVFFAFLQHFINLWAKKSYFKTSKAFHIVLALF